MSHMNISIKDCLAYGNRGDPNYTDNHSGSGIIISGTTGGTVTNCTAHSNGDLNNSNGGGPVGIWTWNADNIVISHCLAYNNSCGTGKHDGGGFDIDGGYVL